MGEKQEEPEQTLTILCTRRCHSGPEWHCGLQPGHVGPCYFVQGADLDSALQRERERIHQFIRIEFESAAKRYAR